MLNTKLALQKLLCETVNVNAIKHYRVCNKKWQSNPGPDLRVSLPSVYLSHSYLNNGSFIQVSEKNLGKLHILSYTYELIHKGLRALKSRISLSGNL
jgi:hypothetical protein